MIIWNEQVMSLLVMSLLMTCKGRIRMEDSHDQRRFTSGHRTVGGEEEDRNNHGGTK